MWTVQNWGHTLIVYNLYSSHHTRRIHLYQPALQYGSVKCSLLRNSFVKCVHNICHITFMKMLFKNFWMEKLFRHKMLCSQNTFGVGNERHVLPMEESDLCSCWMVWYCWLGWVWQAISFYGIDTVPSLSLLQQSPYILFSYFDKNIILLLLQDASLGA